VRPEEIGTGEPAGTHNSTLPSRLHTLVTQIQRLEGTPAAGRMPMNHKTTIEAPPPMPGQ
jgi:hypothetical protein